MTKANGQVDGGLGGINVKRVPVASLHNDPANVRKHDERNLAAIEASIKTFGQVEPLVVQAGTGKVIGGNGRLEVLRRSGVAEVDVVELEIDDTKAAALGIALNRTAELAEWDEGALTKMLESLPDDLQGVSGFTEGELDRMIAEMTPVVEDEAPEPLPEAVSRRGDVWALGGHRLMCGDSTDGVDVRLCLDGAVPFLMVTDPPYGVDYDPNWRNEAAAEGKLAYAARRVGEVQNDDRSDWTEAWLLFPGDVFYCWHAGRHASSVQTSMESAGFQIRNQVIWSKSNFPISRGHYHWRHEPCWYSVRAGKQSRWIGDRKQTTVWEINLDRNCDGGHSTQKPVECMLRPIRNHDAPEVYEPFSGSGTTIIACEQLKRRCFAIEIEPRYVDVGIRRWQKLTGKHATLESSGRTFAEVAAERGVKIEPA